MTKLPLLPHEVRGCDQVVRFSDLLIKPIPPTQSVMALDDKL